MPHGPPPFHVLDGGTRAPPIQVIKKSDSFYWTDKTQKALDDLKALISKPPALASPEPDETLLLYITATTQVISTALVVEWEEPEHVYKVQQPVYNICNVLSNCEIRYNQVQKLLYAILITKRMLFYYFESHPIHVVNLFGLTEIIGNRLTTRRIAKWELKLMGLNIAYIPQTAIKSQALADFVIEWTKTQQHPPPPPPSLKSMGACILMAPLPSTMSGEV
jgi:hypothetical protein